MTVKTSARQTGYHIMKLMLLLGVLSVINTGCGGGSINSSNGNNNSADTTPNLSNGTPVGVLSTGTSSAALTVTTDVDANCRYATASGVDYSTMANTFSTTDGLTHTTAISGLTDGQTYNYYVRCQDGAGNVNTSDYLIAFAIARAGAAYYVSPTGTALWTQCTNIDTPCSWQTAMNNAMAGDTVYFRGGTYDVGVIGSQRDYANMYPVNSGIPGSPITFIAYLNEVPNITGTIDSLSSAAYFGCSYNDYITWDGFAAQFQLYQREPNPVTQIWGAWGSTYCTLTNSEFTGVDVGTRPYNTMFVRIEGSNYTTIENNNFHDLTGTTNAVNTAGIWLFNGNYSSIKGNTFYNTRGGVYGKDEVSSADIYNNFIYNPNDECSDGVSIVYQGTGTTVGFNVYQNIIVGCDRGVRLVTVTSGFLDNAKIYNNNIYTNNDQSGINIYGGVTNVEVFNNIISGASPLLRYYTSSTYSYSNNNLFYHLSSTVWNLNYTTNYDDLSSWSSATGFDINSLTSDPSFVTPGGTNPGDYKLQSGSPALNTGIDRQDYNNDGNTTESINMGAYITGTEIIGIDY